jgi:hypothetical protein
LTHLIGLDMKNIRTRISIIILRILIDHDCPDGLTLERLLGGQDREILQERWFHSTIPISGAIGALRVRSQDNQCSTLQKNSTWANFGLINPELICVIPLNESESHLLPGTPNSGARSCLFGGSKDTQHMIDDCRLG